MKSFPAWQDSFRVYFYVAFKNLQPRKCPFWTNSGLYFDNFIKQALNRNMFQYLINALHYNDLSKFCKKRRLKSTTIFLIH